MCAKDPRLFTHSMIILALERRGKVMDSNPRKKNSVNIRDLLTGEQLKPIRC